MPLAALTPYGRHVPHVPLAALTPCGRHELHVPLSHKGRGA
ncbi:MAG TPA: hypothetical protein PLR99_11140 [Polyangiaceae bacterium]|nr:hypothetical protein [Polyangiaceae bacterium]